MVAPQSNRSPVSGSTIEVLGTLRASEKAPSDWSAPVLTPSLAMTRMRA
jgi:hypothetical protein